MVDTPISSVGSPEKLAPARDAQRTRNRPAKGDADQARRPLSSMISTTLMYLVLIGLVAAMALPLWAMAVASVSTLSSIEGSHLPLWPTSWHLGNFADAWRSQPFGRYYLNSIGTTTLIVIIQMITSSLAAYALAFGRFRGVKVVFRLVILAMFVPVQGIFIASYVLISDYGWINSYKALVIPFAASAFGIFFLTQSFKSFPYAVIESGLIDGCGHLRALFSLVIPNMKPALATLAVLNAVFHFNAFFWPLVITNSPSHRVLPVGLTTMLSESGGDRLVQWNQVMAADMFMVVPLIAVFVFAQRLMVRGVARVGLR